MIYDENANFENYSAESKCRTKLFQTFQNAKKKNHETKCDFKKLILSNNKAYVYKMFIFYEISYE